MSCRRCDKIMMYGAWFVRLQRTIDAGAEGGNPMGSANCEMDRVRESAQVRSQQPCTCGQAVNFWTVVEGLWAAREAATP